MSKSAWTTCKIPPSPLLPNHLLLFCKQLIIFKFSHIQIIQASPSQSWLWSPLATVHLPLCSDSSILTQFPSRPISTYQSMATFKSLCLNPLKQQEWHVQAQTTSFPLLFAQSSQPFTLKYQISMLFYKKTLSTQ